MWRSFGLPGRLADSLFRLRPVISQSHRSPLVSAVVPTHNRATLLEGALQSIVDQEYESIEVIVVDNASADDTGGVVERFSRVFEERGAFLKYKRLDINSGPAAARNAGVAVATGSFLAFLDSDDLWHPRFLTATMGLLTMYPDCAVAFTGAMRVDEDKHALGLLEHRLPPSPEAGVLHAPFELMARQMPFRTSCTLVRRTAFDEVGGFDETLLVSEDWDLWWRLGKQFDFAYMLAPLMEYPDPSGNMSQTRADGAVYSLRFYLRYIGDVQDPRARSAVVERIQRCQTQLQE